MGGRPPARSVARLAVAVLAGCLVLAGVASAPVHAQGPSPERPVVLVVGDSIADQFAVALRGLVADRADVEFLLSIGGHGYDDRELGQVADHLGTVAPDVTVVLAGTWDASVLVPPSGAPVADPEAAVARYEGLAGEVDRWARTLHAASRDVVWIMPPSARDLDHEVHQVVVRELYRSLADELGSTVVDGSTAIGDAAVFVESILEGGSAVRVRSPDGLHLCPDGARRLAAAVAAVEPVLAGAVGSVVGRPSGGSAWTGDEAFSRAGCAEPAPAAVRVLGVVEASRVDARSASFFDRLR